MNIQRRELIAKKSTSRSLLHSRDAQFSPWSQSFSRGYGSNLPTSLTHIIQLTKGCSPWGPDAVIGTTRCKIITITRCFKGRAKRTRHIEIDMLYGIKSLSSAEPYPGNDFLNRRRRLRLGLDSSYRGLKRYRLDPREEVNLCIQAQEY